MAIPSAPPHSGRLLLPSRTCPPRGTSPPTCLTLSSGRRRPALQLPGTRFRRSHCPPSTAPRRLRPPQHHIRWAHRPILIRLCMHLRPSTFVSTRTRHIFRPSNSLPRHTRIQTALMTVSPRRLLCCPTIHPSRPCLPCPLQSQITSTTAPRLILLKGMATPQTTI